MLVGAGEATVKYHSCAVARLIDVSRKQFVKHYGHLDRARGVV